MEGSKPACISAGNSRGDSPLCSDGFFHLAYFPTDFPAKRFAAAFDQPEPDDITDQDVLDGIDERAKVSAASIANTDAEQEAAIPWEIKRVDRQPQQK